MLVPIMIATCVASIFAGQPRCNSLIFLQDFPVLGVMLSTPYGNCCSKYGARGSLQEETRHFKYSWMLALRYFTVLGFKAVMHR